MTMGTCSARIVPSSGTVTWKVGQQLKKECFQFLVGAVDLVDEQHR